MTDSQKRKQITALFGAYSKRLEQLYDEFIKRLSQLAVKTHVSVNDMLSTDVLFRFDKFPELREEFNRIFADYVQNEMLCYKAGITDGVALAYTQDNGVIGAFSILSDEALRQARETAAKTFIRTRLNAPKGLNLSQLVWNYAQQTKSEFEVAVSNVLADGLQKGTSAAELGRSVRQYLNNPDMMYRRYHRTVIDAHGNKKDIVRWRRRIIDEQGKVRFVEEPLEKVGMGHYRSSRMNSERLMRTEINTAYHRANSERWQKEPFVIGIVIDLSPQHPAPDECDELQGRYPKDFVFIGWHPQCLCMSNPITIQGEEKKEFYRRLAAGEDMSNWHSKYEVKDIPDKAKAWIDANHDKFVRAGGRGTLGYVWQENQKYIRPYFSKEEQQMMGIAPQEPVRTKRVKTAEEKADIQRRWDERKKNNEIITRGRAFLENIKDFPELKTFGLEEAINERDYARVASIVETIRPRLKYERSITPTMLLDSVMRSKYGDEAVEQLYANTKRTISSKVKGSVDEKIKALRYEADWVVKNRSFATVKEVAAYYEREAVRLEAMRDFDIVKSEIEAVERKLSKYGVKSVLNGNEWYGDINAMRGKLDGLEKYKTKFERIEKLEEFAKTSKSPVIHSHLGGIKLTLQQYGIDASVDNLLAEAEKNMKRLQNEAALRARKAAEKAAEEYRKKMEALYGKRITVDDLKKILGGQLPKTLSELEEAIKQYGYTNPLLKANEAEINTRMKKLFDDNDLGMDISHIYLESVFNNGFYNTFQSGTSKGYCGSHKTTGKIEQGHSRLAMAHKMFFPSTHGSLNGGSYTGKQLAREEYEKYGHLIDRDKLQSLEHNMTHYGDVQVRFKKDKVLATWTFDDSLCLWGEYFQPSLVTDPRVESFDRKNTKMLASSLTAKTDKSWEHLWEWQRAPGHNTSYVELQFHGKVDIDCVESITFKSKPEDWISEELIRKLKDKGIELWYKDGDKIKLYQ